MHKIQNENAILKVMLRRLSQLDHRLTASMQGKPPALRFVMLGATFLGLPVVTAAIVTLGLVLSFGFHNTPITVALLLCFVAIGINMLLKLVLQRARPETLYATSMRFKTYSFPSGHSFGAFVLYGLCAYILQQYITDAWVYWAVGGLVALIILVGVSRVYLGAHYVLDVIGGWMLGAVALWAIIATILP